MHVQVHACVRIEWCNYQGSLKFKQGNKEQEENITRADIESLELSKVTQQADVGEKNTKADENAAPVKVRDRVKYLWRSRQTEKCVVSYCCYLARLSVYCFLEQQRTTFLFT